CGRTFETTVGRGVHRSQVHGEGPEHGTLTRYRHGCRCSGCKEANRDQKRRDRRWRDHLRAIDRSPQTLSACLVAFGVPEKKLAEALRTRSVESLHWDAWRVSGDLRLFCRCEAPREIAEEIREGS
ncbi:MAG: hypothetical protein M3Q49_16360, partial [Actinomycetota bacterium]|nr:hypothetical protein [Actinomycetota bacterium]